MDLVLCNPHTLKNDQLAKNPNPHLAIARHEIHVSSRSGHCVGGFIKTNGRLAMVHRPDRFLDILHAMENANIAPKKLGLFIRSQAKKPMFY